MYGFFPRNVRYPRYQDTDLLQLCSQSTKATRLVCEVDALIYSGYKTVMDQLLTHLINYSGEKQ